MNSTGFRQDVTVLLLGFGLFFIVDLAWGVIELTAQLPHVTAYEIVSLVLTAEMISSGLRIQTSSYTIPFYLASLFLVVAVILSRVKAFPWMRSRKQRRREENKLFASAMRRGRGEQ